MGKKAMYTEGKDYATGIGTHCLSHISPYLNENYCILPCMLSQTQYFVENLQEHVKQHPRIQKETQTISNPIFGGYVVTGGAVNKFNS